jgi:hypothetical protein
MLYAAQANRAHPLVATLVSTCLGILASSSGFAQPAGVVPITAEPDHKSRFDNGRVRMYEVVLPKGKATLMHEHRADSFTVFFRTAEVTNEPPEEASQRYSTEQQVLWDFTSTAKGPYSHRVIASGETTFHVIAVTNACWLSNHSSTCGLCVQDRSGESTWSRLPHYARPWRID